MTFTMVEDELRVILSWQITSVPFISLLAGLVTNLVISGEGEILEKVNKTELTIRSSGPSAVRLLRSRLPYLTAVVLFSGTPKTVHSTWLPVMLQVNSS